MNKCHFKDPPTSACQFSWVGWALDPWVSDDQIKSHNVVYFNQYRMSFLLLEMALPRSNSLLTHFQQPTQFSLKKGLWFVRLLELLQEDSIL